MPAGRERSQGRTEIVYLTRAAPDQLEVWRKATKAFMRQNPDVKVRFENLPYAQYWDKFQTMAVAGVAPLPKHRVRANNSLGSCLSIPSKSQHKEAAWRYIKFLTGPEGQKIVVGSDFSTPARKSIARSQYFLQRPPESETVFVGEIPFGHLVPFTPKYLEMDKVAVEVMDLMWLGRSSVPETCREIDRRLNKILSRE